MQMQYYYDDGNTASCYVCLFPILQTDVLKFLSFSCRERNMLLNIFLKMVWIIVLYSADCGFCFAVQLNCVNFTVNLCGYDLVS